MKNHLITPPIKIRESNFELFRIVAMFLVLVVHFNGWYLGTLEAEKIYSPGGDKELFRFIIESFSIVCVNCFILISGYFSIHPSFKSLYTLFTQILFFYLITYLFGILSNYETFSVKRFIGCFFAFSRANWFVQSYLMLMLFAPLLNTFIEKNKRRNILLYTTIYFFVSFYFGVFWNLEYAGFHEGYSFTHFIMLYLMGTCIRLYKNELPYSKKIWLFGYLVCTLVILLLGITKVPFVFYYNNPVVVLSSLALFLHFGSYHFKSRAVNWIASSAFAVFLLHTSPPFGEWLKAIDIHIFQHNSILLYSVTVLPLLICIFVLSVLLDKIRMACFKPLYPYSQKVFNVLPNWFTRRFSFIQ